MPTGYTAKLMDQGQPFNEFVWQCARAMGALIMMRDDPMDAPIPEKFEPSDYYTKSVREATERLALLNGMTNEQKIAEGKRLRADDVKQHEEWLTKELVENERLEAMERQVLAWEPPSSDYQPFKDFMLNQLKISKHRIEYQQERIAESRAKSPVDLFSEAVAQAARSILRGQEELANELERTAGRNAWIKQLRDSLAAARTPANHEAPVK